MKVAGNWITGLPMVAVPPSCSYSLPMAMTRAALGPSPVVPSRIWLYSGSRSP